MSNPPVRKSKLEPFSQEIFSLRDSGKTEQNIVEFLASEKGIKVSRQTLNYFLKKSEQGLSEVQEQDDNITQESALTELKQARLIYEKKFSLLEDKYKAFVKGYEEIALNEIMSKKYSLPSDDDDTLWLIYYRNMAIRMREGVFYGHYSRGLLGIQSFLCIMRDSEERTKQMVEKAANWVPPISVENIKEDNKISNDEKIETAQSDNEMMGNNEPENSISPMIPEENPQKDYEEEMKQAKLHYDYKASFLSPSAKAKLYSYECDMLKAIKGMEGDFYLMALRNYYQNVAGKMNGTELILPPPMQ